MPSAATYTAVRARIALEQLRRAIARDQYTTAAAIVDATPPSTRLTPADRAAVERVAFWRRSL